MINNLNISKINLNAYDERYIVRKYIKVLEQGNILAAKILQRKIIALSTGKKLKMAIKSAQLADKNQILINCFQYEGFVKRKMMEDPEYFDYELIEINLERETAFCPTEPLVKKQETIH